MGSSQAGDELKRKGAGTAHDESDRPAKVRERFPELVGRYKPIESLGQGTYAVVWRAVSLHGDDKGKEVAVKRFKTQHNKVSRLQNEAEMLVQCRCAPPAPRAPSRADSPGARGRDPAPPHARHAPAARGPHARPPLAGRGAPREQRRG